MIAHKGEILQEAMADVEIQPAIPLVAKRIWLIYKAGRMAAQANTDLGITKTDVWLHMMEDSSIGDEIDKWMGRILHGGPEQQVLAAIQKSNGKVRGVVWPNITDGTRYLSKLYVAKEAQGLGIGSKLIQAAQIWHQFEPIRLKVAAYNPAQHLYERFGFETVEELDCGYKIGGKPVPQKVMAYPGHRALPAFAIDPLDLRF